MILDSEEIDRWRVWDNRLAALHEIRLGMSRRLPLHREDDGSSYANRVPQRQSLYDWAPGSDDEDLYHELLSRANIPTFAQSARPRSMHLNFESHRRSHSRSRLRPRGNDGSRPPNWTEASRRDDSPRRADPSPSTAALLQSVEQHRRFNARARSTLQNYILDRDRRNNHEPTPAASTWARLHRSDQQPLGSPYPAIRSISSQVDLRDVHRQLFLENPSLARLKNSICYLSQLRHCDTVEEGLTLATDLAIDDPYTSGHKRSFDRCTKLSDLIVDTSTLPSVAECSWLTPGTVFIGSQHTPREPPPAMVYRDRNHDRDPHSRLERYRHDRHQALQERQRRRAYIRNGIYRESLPPPISDVAIQHSSSSSSNPPPSDHWLCTVTLHDICFSTLTLSGTMSATHIPNKLSTPHASSSLGSSSMRSFFEGEIIDFKTHSLETENFCTGPDNHTPGHLGGISNDARYWRDIGPFRELREKEQARKRNLHRNNTTGNKFRGPPRQHADGDGDSDLDSEDDEDDDDERVEDALGGEDTIATHLRSRSWIENVLLRDWILMRWKERCFIDDGGPVGDAIQVEGGASGAPAPPSQETVASSPPLSWGLTISGFYYVALRRQTGEIDGLYYDPGSLPFQVLELRPRGFARPRGHRAGEGGRRGGGGGGVPGIGGIKTSSPALGLR